MYPTNSTEFFNTIYPVVDNQTVLSLQGAVNGTTPIILNSTGYVTVVADLRGMDWIILGLISIAVLQTIIVAFMAWDFYLKTWGGRKHL